MKEKRMKKSGDSLRDLWDNIKQTNTCIIGVPEGEEREKGAGNLFEEIMAKTFLTWGRKHIQIQEAQRIPVRGTQKDSHQDTL